MTGSNGGYGLYEVVVYGGGEVYRDVFNAVALMSGTGPIDSLFRLMILLGLLLGLLKAMGDFNFATLLKWFVGCAMIYGILWVPKVNIAITDRLDSGFPSAVIGNVPLGIAFVAATSSQIGDTVIKSTEQAFADPQGLAYSDNGLIYGAKLYNQMRSWRILDSLFALNMESFFTNCTYNDVLSNAISVGDLESSQNLWAFVRDSANPATSFPYWTQKDQYPNIVTCQQGAQNLDQAWAAEIPNNEAAQQVRLVPNQNTGEAQAQMSSSLTALTQATGMASQAAAQTFQQALTINSLRQALSGYAGQTGGNLVGALGQTQAQLQTQDTQQMIGSTAEKALVTLQIVITVLFIGMFPILAPAFLLPGLGLSMMKGYFGGFIYLQLWGPMYVILNKVMMWQVTHQTAAAMYVPNSSTYNINLANLNSVGALNADLAGVAGCMAAAIPMIAGMLTKGAMAGAEAAAGGVLHTFQRSAEAAGTAISTGNFTFASTAVDTHQFHNTSGNRIQTSPFEDRGQRSYIDAAGTQVTQHPDGTFTAQAANSNVPWSARISEGIANSATQNSTRYREEGRAVEKTYSQASSAVDQRISEFSRQLSEGRTRTDTDGLDDRSGTREVYDKRVQISKNIGEHYKMGQSDTQALINAASVEVGVEGNAGVALPLGGEGTPFKLGASASGSLRDSWRKEHGQSDFSQAQLEYARQQMKTSGYSDAVDHAKQQFATKVWSSNYGSSDTQRNVTSSAFSNSRTAAETSKRLSSEGDRWAETADRARRTDFTRDVNYTNAGVEYLADRYRQGKPVRDVHGEIVPFGTLINPVGPDAAHITDLRDEALKPIFSTLANRFAVDPGFEQKLSAPLPEVQAGAVKNGGAHDQGIGSRVTRELSGAPDRKAIASPSENGLDQVDQKVDRDTGIVGKAIDQSPTLKERRRDVDAGHFLTGARRIGWRP